MKNINTNEIYKVTVDVVEPEYSDLYNPDDSIEENLTRIMKDEYPDLTVVSASEGDYTWASLTVSGTFNAIVSYLKDYYSDDENELIDELARVADMDRYELYNLLVAKEYIEADIYDICAKAETILDEAGCDLNDELANGLLFERRSDAEEAQDILLEKGFNVWYEENETDEGSMFEDFKYVLCIDKDTPITLK